MSDKRCPKCGIVKLLTEFYPDTSTKSGLASHCKTCKRIGAKERQARYRANNKQKIAISWSQYYYSNKASKYGLSRAQFDAIVEKQNNRCAVCRSEFTVDSPPHVDHDHACCSSRKKSCGKCLRELLCRLCNLGLGYFKDSPELLQAAIVYLSRYKEAA